MKKIIEIGLQKIIEILYTIRVQSQPSGKEMMLEQLIYFKLQAVDDCINMVIFSKCVRMAPDPEKANEIKNAR